jgi:RNA polymerase sigma-70 factor (ECF subfamily)
MSKNVDWDIMQKIARGDQDAFRALYGEHKKRVWGLCLRIMGSEKGAEDMAQETWIKIIKHADSYRPIASLAAWISQITRNTCLNGLRDLTWDKDLSDVEETLESDFDLEQTFITLSQRKVLDQAFATLPAQQRAVITMSVYEELSHAEIAKELSVSVGAVKQLIVRAKSHLQKYFEEKEEA